MLALIPLLPLFGFVVLALVGTYLPKRLVAIIGCGTIAMSGIVIALLFPHAAVGVEQSFGIWIAGVGELTPTFRLLLDPLSATMAAVVCFVGFLIHLYSVEYMATDPGFARFFAYLNLFVSMMLTLLLASDLLLLFLGWEGVGLCSYLLIGFWYQEVANGHAAQKAFIVTRIGDVAFLVALFLLFDQFGTSSLPELKSALAEGGFASATLQAIVCWLLLAGAVGKSAQLPLQVWLPDAMAGPTPVSALIHAATMVTAGVYLIARLHYFFLPAPDVLLFVGIVGGLTALYAALSALGQTDIKRVLAYSTISQIGYMFLGLGVGAFSAAIFHFMTHAFFKALLFLAAGAVIHAAHGEQDMRALGGLRSKLPFTFWTFVIGSGALAALPLVTAGFYSKDAILFGAYAGGHLGLWLIGLVTALLTGLYTARMVSYTFLGKEYTRPLHPPGRLIKLPLGILALGSLVAGFVEIPHTLGGWPLWSHWLQPAFAQAPILMGSVQDELTSQLVAALFSVAGIVIGFLVFVRFRLRLAHWSELGRGKLWGATAAAGFYWDRTYELLFVRGFERLAARLGPEWVDSLFHRIAAACRLGHEILRASQAGRVRWYVIGIVLGAIALSAGVLSL